MRGCDVHRVGRRSTGRAGIAAPVAGVDPVTDAPRVHSVEAKTIDRRVHGGAPSGRRTVEDLQVLDVRHDRVDPHVPRARSRREEPLVRRPLVVVLDVSQVGQHELLFVALAARLARLLTCPGEHGEEDRRQDSNDSDDHQQFDQGKARRPSHPDHLALPESVLMM